MLSYVVWCNRQCGAVAGTWQNQSLIVDTNEAFEKRPSSLDFCVRFKL